MISYLSGNTMCAHDQSRSEGDLVEILYEYRPLGSQIGHHMVVVNDLVPHINGRTKLLKRTLNDLDGPINTRTKPSGLG